MATGPPAAPTREYHCSPTPPTETGTTRGHRASSNSYPWVSLFTYPNRYYPWPQGLQQLLPVSIIVHLPHLPKQALPMATGPPAAPTREYHCSPTPPTETGTTRGHRASSNSYPWVSLFTYPNRYYPWPQGLQQLLPVSIIVHLPKQALPVASGPPATPTREYHCSPTQTGTTRGLRASSNSYPWVSLFTYPNRHYPWPQGLQQLLPVSIIVHLPHLPKQALPVASGPPATPTHEYHCSPTQTGTTRGHRASNNSYPWVSLFTYPNLPKQALPVASGPPATPTREYHCCSPTRLTQTGTTHGHRASNNSYPWVSLFTYPTDPNRHYPWPQGLQQLLPVSIIVVHLPDWPKQALPMATGPPTTPTHEYHCSPTRLTQTGTTHGHRASNNSYPWVSLLFTYLTYPNRHYSWPQGLQ